MKYYIVNISDKLDYLPYMIAAYGHPNIVVRELDETVCLMEFDPENLPPNFQVATGYAAGGYEEWYIQLVLRRFDVGGFSEEDKVEVKSEFGKRVAREFVAEFSAQEPIQFADVRALCLALILGDFAAAKTVAQQMNYVWFTNERKLYYRDMVQEFLDSIN